MDISIKPIYSNNDDNQILAGSFKWMSLGLLISGLVSWFVASTPTLIQLIVGSSFGFIILIILELALVWYLSAKILTISKEAAHWLFIAYAILNGLTLSMIFFSYELTSIISIFFSTAIMFWLLGLYGSRTKKDLTSLGRLATFGLIGLIIAFVINIFIANSGLDLILSFVGVIIFTALTAYDVQKIKRLASSLNSNDSGRIVILGALTLYLDVVNLFLNLLRIFGRRK
jgi:hypothetical protein